MTNYLSYGCNGVGAWQHSIARAGLYTCPGSPIPSGFRSTSYIAYGCNNQGAWLLVRA
ncbi:hypothetical protein ACM614_15475 [Streptomyces sp. 12297]